MKILSFPSLQSGPKGRASWPSRSVSWLSPAGAVVVLAVVRDLGLLGMHRGVGVDAVRTRLLVVAVVVDVLVFAEGHVEAEVVLECGVPDALAANLEVEHLAGLDDAADRGPQDVALVVVVAVERASSRSPRYNADTVSKREAASVTVPAAGAT